MGRDDNRLPLRYLLSDNSKILPAVKITGADFDSFSMEQIEQQQQHEVQKQGLLEIPKSGSTVMNKSGGDEDVGYLASPSDVCQGGEILLSSSDQESTTFQSGSNDTDEALHEVNSIEKSASESITSSSEDDTDDEDFLDLLANSLDGEFDFDLMF